MTTLQVLLNQLQSVRTTSDWDRVVVSLAAQTLSEYYTELVERRRDMAALQRLVEEWQGK